MILPWTTRLSFDFLSSFVSCSAVGEDTRARQRPALAAQSPWHERGSSSKTKGGGGGGVGGRGSGPSIDEG